MILSYWIRLLLLCSAIFFMTHTVVCLAVWVFERRAIRLAEQMRARAAARFLLTIRILPFGAATIVALGYCAPSYLRFESNALSEHAGPVCLTAALLGILLASIAGFRGLHAALSSTWFTRLCDRTGWHTDVQGTSGQLLVIPEARPFLALCGIFRARVVISERLLREFPPDELSAALSHERAHWIFRDNLKRLVLAFLPDALPFMPSLKPLEQSWARFSERAADDFVSATDEAQAVSLASALVRLARIGSGADVRWAPLVTSPLGGTDDLSGRVDRLLAPEQPNVQFPSSRNSALIAAGAAVMVSFAAVLAWPATLSPMHELLERLLH